MGNSDLSERYLWGPAVDQLLAQEAPQAATEGQTTLNPGAVDWALTDNQGTVRDMAVYNSTTGATSIAMHSVYRSYGNLVSQSNPWAGSVAAVDCLFGYTGCPFSTATGLQYNDNRWYDPATQRWLSQDPSGLEPDSNPYRYCGDGPTDGTDPEGLADENNTPFFGWLTSGNDKGPSIMERHGPPPSQADNAKMDLRNGTGPLNGLSVMGQTNQQYLGQTVAPMAAAINAPFDLLMNRRDQYWNEVKQAWTGIYWQAPAGLVTGTIDMVTHPIQTAQGVFVALTHPIDTALAIKNQVSNTILYGDVGQQGELVGNILLLFVPTGEAVETLGRYAKVGKYAAKIEDAAAPRLMMFDRETKTVKDLGLASKSERFASAADIDAALCKAACFVAGTPVLLPEQQDASGSAAEMISESMLDSRRWIFAATICVGAAVLALNEREDEKEEEQEKERGIATLRLRRSNGAVGRKADKEPELPDTKEPFPIAMPAYDSGSTPDAAASLCAPSLSHDSRMSETQVLTIGRGQSVGGVRLPRKNRPARKFWSLRRMVAVTALLVGVCLLGVGMYGRTTARSHRASVQTGSPSSSSRSIETIRVGQRVLSHNPDVAESARTTVTSVDASTWRLLQLHAESHWPDGTLDTIEVETLQAPDWVKTHRASMGAMVPIPLDLVEMGLPEGLVARVVAIEQCPLITAGPGKVVLTTVNHLNSNIFRLVVADEQGNRETIHPTAFHKFYGVDRRRWVSAEDLRHGERLGGTVGPLTVISVEHLPGVRRVYNMTVEGEHVYYVSTLGAVAHNLNCAQSLDRLHHAWPQYLGGPIKQQLEVLPKSVHDAYHSGLDKILKRQIRGGAIEFYSSLSAAEQAANFQKFMDYTVDFDKTHGTHLWDAVVREATTVK